MITYALIFYMSTFAGNLSTGGPAVIDGFLSLQKCEAAIKVVETAPKFDWARCVPVIK
jgi:hypothetical protein